MKTSNDRCFDARAFMPPRESEQRLLNRISQLESQIYMLESKKDYSSAEILWVSRKEYDRVLDRCRGLEAELQANEKETAYGIVCPFLTLGHDCSKLNKEAT